MTLQQLEYIVALDEVRNFVKAAVRCRVTQPTLTMQVQKLEEETGFRIFDRSRKPLTPTSLGRQFIARSRTIISGIHEMKLMVQDEIESVKGEFRLGIIPTLAPYLLPLFLPELIKHYPDTHLIIEELQSVEIIDRLKNNQLDLALLATPLLEKNIREIPVFSEPFLLYLPVNHPLLKQDAISPEKLDPQSLLLLAEGHCFRNQALHLCHIGKERRSKGFTYNSGSIEALKGFVDKRMGYTLVPELSVSHELRTKPSIKRFSKPEPSREISIACNTAFSREKLLEIVREIIQQNLPPNLMRSRNYIRVKWR
jgi:LysR family transcriptional regulator, hydrogen peroxide-inducible genes activator